MGRTSFLLLLLVGTACAATNGTDPAAVSEVTGLTDVESLQLEMANVVVSILSILGSIFIITCYIYLRDLRTFAFRLVFMVAVSDVFYSLGLFLGDAGGSASHLGASPALCTLQAILISYFQLTSLTWAVSIAFTLHMAFLRELPSFAPNEVERHNLKYHLVCWGLPLLLTSLPAFTNSYGDTGGWCWISSLSSAGTTWRFLQFYIWLWAAIAYNFYVFPNIYRKLREFQSAAGDDESSSSSMARRLRLYPVVLLVCHTPGTILSIYEAASGSQLFWLHMMTVIFSASMGLLNALIYGLTPEVAKQVCFRKQVIDSEFMSHEMSGP